MLVAFLHAFRLYDSALIRRARLEHSKTCNIAHVWLASKERNSLNVSQACVHRTVNSGRSAEVMLAR